MHQLGQVRGEEHQVDGQQHGPAAENQPQWRAGPGPGQVEEQQRGDRDRAGDRHAERVRQR